MIRYRKHWRVSTFLLFTLSFFISFPSWAHAAPVATKKVVNNVTLYTYDSQCSSDLIKKTRGIIVPNGGSGNTYLYIHGNDAPTVSKMCNGPTYDASGKATGYGLCDVAGSIGATILIPEVNIAGSSSKKVTATEMNCFLTEATQVLVGATPSVTLSQNYTLVGHSGAGYFMKSYYADAKLTTASAIIFDGCYNAWCEDLVKAYPGQIRMYYQIGTDGTETGSKKAYAAGSSHADLFKVGVSHYQLVPECFKDLASCGGKVLEKNVAQVVTAPTAPAPTLANPQSAVPLGDLDLPSGISDLNQLGTTSLPLLIGRFLRVLLGIVGSIALVVMVSGGLMWMTAFGSSDRTDKAKDLLVWGAFGVIVIFSSYAIVAFLFDVF